MSERRPPGEQKMCPRNEWEALALAAYKALGLPCLWMPESCSFDFVVNGHRVDVKGGEAKSRYAALSVHFCILDDESSRAGESPVDRCDFFHLVTNGPHGRPYHFIVPSSLVNDLTTLSLSLEPPSRRWFRYLHAWQQINGCALALPSDDLRVPLIWAGYGDWIGSGGARTGSALREGMRNLGLSAADVAARAGYTPDYMYTLISRWRDREIGHRTVRRLNEAIALLARGEEPVTVAERERAAAPAPVEVAQP